MDKPEELHPDSKVIDNLGGTAAVARLCECQPPSVSEWRRNGIPKARRQFLQLVNPKAFAPDDEKKAA